MKSIRSFSDTLNTCVIIVCALAITAMLTISFVGALYQAITGDSLSWTYSLARQFIPWIGLLSITVAFKNGEHVAMTMLADSFPFAIRQWVERVVVGLIFVFAVFMIYEGTYFFIDSNQLVMISDQIQISQRWVAISVPITGGVLLVHTSCGRALLEDTQDFTDLLSPTADGHESGPDTQTTKGPVQ
ncbi:TRAP transporter small permease [Roseibium algae]|uniref:TRAP transporter small permease protein n=1 Tax=Roseibium algae TaxID=3123038 RepID=A0ABU8TEF1_9HYPH